MTEQPEFDFSVRDAVLSKHQRTHLCRWVEYECSRLGRDVSVNDCRALIPVKMDLRVLGGAFPPSRWVQSGWTKSIGQYSKGGNHGRKVQVFRLRDGVEVAPVDRPDFLREQP